MKLEKKKKSIKLRELAFEFGRQGCAYSGLFRTDNYLKAYLATLLPLILSRLLQ